MKEKVTILRTKEQLAVTKQLTDVLRSGQDDANPSAIITWENPLMNLLRI